MAYDLGLLRSLASLRLRLFHGSRVLRTKAGVRTALCFFCVTFVYLYPSPFYPEIDNPNENVRLYMTKAMVERGTYRIDAAVAAGARTVDMGSRDGHYYSVKAPLTSFLGVPGYALYVWLGSDDDHSEDRLAGLWWTRITASVLPSLLFFVWFRRWLGHQTRDAWIADLTLVATALGTVCLGYAYLFASHTTCAAAAFGAFMLITDARRQGTISKARAFFAGLLTAATPAFEYPAIVVALILCGYALISVRPWARLGFFATGGSIPTAMVMHFQHHAFGNAWTPGHQFSETASFRAIHEQGLFGLSEFSWEAATGLLFDYRVGLFSLSPFLLFAILGFVRLLASPNRGRAAAWVALLITVLSYVSICFFPAWHGGWAIGPRHLIVVIPFLSWAALIGLDRTMPRLPRLTITVALGLAMAGIVLAGIESMYYPHVQDTLRRPFGRLFTVLIAHGYAPRNLANAIGIFGTVSMMPAFVAAALPVVALAFTARGLGLANRLLVLLGASALCALWLGPHLDRDEAGPQADADVAFVVEHWNPAGHDCASQLEAALREGRVEDPAEAWSSLGTLYVEEGRVQKARRAFQRSSRDSR